jgi:hypothetical protein
MYTLYGYKGSGSAAVEAALQRIAVPYKTIKAASWDPQSAVQELTRVNPLAQVPTLVLPDGTVLTESAAILIHLGRGFWIRALERMFLSPIYLRPVSSRGHLGWNRNSRGLRHRLVSGRPFHRRRDRRRGKIPLPFIAMGSGSGQQHDCIPHLRHSAHHIGYEIRPSLIVTYRQLGRHIVAGVRLKECS